MSWEELTKAKEESGRYIKLKDGQSIEGVFVGEPRCFYKKYQDPKEYSTWEEGRNFRFQINFLTKNEEGQLVARIFEQGAKARNALLVVKEEYGLDCVFKIKRVGSGKEDTSYSILFKDRLTPERLEEIKKVQLHDLKSPSQDLPEFDDEFPPAQEPPPWIKDVFTK